VKKLNVNPDFTFILFKFVSLDPGIFFTWELHYITFTAVNLFRVVLNCCMRLSRVPYAQSGAPWLQRLNKSSCLAAALGVTEYTPEFFMNLITLCSVA
jgi:hypothetical protein